MPREFGERLGLSALIDESVCYHPFFVFNQDGDCVAAKLRPGNVHSADGWDELLLPVIDRYRARGQTVVVRGDAAFAVLALYEALERRGGAYAIRLPATAVLERAIEDLLTRPRGRPSHAPLVRYRRFHYQAPSWDRPRRGIAKVEHHRGEVFLPVGFIVTTLTGPPAASTTGAGRPSNGSRAGKPPPTRRASPATAFGRMRSASCSGSSPIPWAISYAGSPCPSPSRAGPLTSLQQRLFKTGGRLVRHARYFRLQLAGSHLTQRLCGKILGRIERLAWYPT